MGTLVMNYLRNLGTKSVAILDAICDENLEQSYKLIQENPTISKAEFLERMQISEE
jgi:thermostable 8-oxoguanine DNA glycosylase